eukprot:TRINITY_DN9191_c0_g1_i1.p1 TRINITY_DN9191_c0_g1~~TRINITY_DN9191_c0_g1_i1.p1  ORF type:complete len:980 (+),score=198.96 TRINITY_DN9191_c0_g1_i1:213-2942(+)
MAGGRQTSRRGRKSFEAAMRHALEYGSSSDEGGAETPAPRSANSAGSSGSVAAKTGSREQSLSEASACQNTRKPAGLGVDGGDKKSSASTKGHQFKADNPANAGGAKPSTNSQGVVKGESVRDGTGRQYTRKRNGPKSYVGQGKDDESTPEKGPDAARIRLRGAAAHGKGGGKGRRGGGNKPADADDSGDERQPEEEELKRWQSELEMKRDSGSEDLRTAFSLKPCSAQDIRRLGPEAFLGGKGLEAGGKPLYDLNGKVSLQWLLATYRGMEIVKEKHRQGNETSDLIDGAERDLLRFLVKKARELQLVSRREIKRGSVAPQRLENARRSGNYALTVDSNLAEASDEETQLKRNSAMEQAKQTASANGMSTQFDVHLFDRLQEARRENAADQDENAGLLRQKIRSQVTGKMGNINVASSHGLDLAKMRDQLTAPTFSFDWDDGAANDEEEDAGDSAGILEVDVPDKNMGAESRRHHWREQMRRSVSFSQARNLAKADRTFSNASINSSASRDSFADAEPATAGASSGRRQKSGIAEAKSKAPKEDPSSVKRSLTFDEDDSQPAMDKSATENEIVSEISKMDDVTAPIDVILRPDVDETDDKAAAQPKESTMAPAPAWSEPEKQAEKECSEYASDTAATQTMPGDEGIPCGDSLMEEVAERMKDVESAQTLEGLDEISPTLPFKAEVRAEDDNFEISPTLPFRAVVDQASVDQRSSSQFEISPTLPFDAKLGPSTIESHATHTEEIDQIAVVEKTLQREEPPAARARGSKRDASVLSEPSGSGDEGLDENAMGNTQDAAEDAERERRELEWLRHKRRSLRQEIGKQKDQESQARKTARKAQRAAALGAATMTGEDRHRYAAVVADSSTASTLAQLKEQDADDDLIASQRRLTTTRRPTFFATGNVGAKSV